MQRIANQFSIEQITQASISLDGKREFVEHDPSAPTEPTWPATAHSAQWAGRRTAEGSIGGVGEEA